MSLSTALMDKITWEKLSKDIQEEQGIPYFPLFKIVCIIDHFFWGNTNRSNIKSFSLSFSFLTISSSV